MNARLMQGSRKKARNRVALTLPKYEKPGFFDATKKLTLYPEKKPGFWVFL
jgi:hypothetical protein